MKLHRTVTASVLVGSLFAGKLLLLGVLYTLAGTVCIGCEERYLALIAFLSALLMGTLLTSQLLQQYRYLSQILLPILLGCLSVRISFGQTSLVSLIIALVISGFMVIPFLYSWGHWLSKGFTRTGCLLLVLMSTLSAMLSASIHWVNPVASELKLTLSSFFLIAVPVAILLRPSTERQRCPES